MPLQRYAHSLVRIAMAGIAFLLLGGCAKAPLQVDKNRPPRTFIVAAPGSAVARDTTVASYRIHLYWRGEDPDGYVVGFLWSFDDSSIGHFRYTTKTDSIFEVAVNDSDAVSGGSQLLGLSRLHTFFVRAVDNLGKGDPNLAVWNRRLYKATTIAPKVCFVGDYEGRGTPCNGVGSPPSGNGIDTLSDAAPFKVCWSGNDSDGAVVRYKFDAGTYSSPLRSDTCAYFNDPGATGSVALASGLYGLTVTAVDNAYAVGKNSFLLVVNHDPETWFEPKGSPIGHYIQPYFQGDLVNTPGTFAEGDTVPFRSTIWFTWDGEDVKGRESNCLSGFALNLRAGTRNNAEPYTIGFLDTLTQGPPPVRFKTNDPAVLGPPGFTSLILDSLDAGFNMIMLVASRDCSGRADGTPAAFRFNCNRRPELRGTLTVHDSVTSEPGKAVYWNSYDFEDGLASGAQITEDGLKIVVLTDRQQSIFIPDRDFLSLAPSNPHSVEVRVKDRAGFESDNTLTAFFDVVSPSPSPTPRVKE